LTFEEATREAALVAQKAVTKATERLRRRRRIDEDDPTGVLVGQLDAAFDWDIGGLTWDCTILRHRSGKAAEEKKIGADLLIHVEMDTPTQLIQRACSSRRIRSDPGAT
jgi:hypothetical protein